MLALLLLTSLHFHSEVWVLTKKMAIQGAQKLGFTIPLVEPLPSVYYVHLVSDNWLGVSASLCISVPVCVCDNVCVTCGGGTCVCVCKCVCV
jgi:hypothetical protein